MTHLHQVTRGKSLFTSRQWLHLEGAVRLSWEQVRGAMVRRSKYFLPSFWTAILGVNSPKKLLVSVASEPLPHLE